MWARNSDLWRFAASTSAERSSSAHSSRSFSSTLTASAAWRRFTRSASTSDNVSAVEKTPSCIAWLAITLPGAKPKPRAVCTSTAIPMPPHANR